MSVTSTTMADVLKIDYQGPIVDLINRQALLFKYIQKSKRKRRGKLVYIPYNNGEADTAEYGSGSTLPASNDQEYSHTEWKHKKIYGTLEFEGDVIEQAMNGEPDAFVDAVDEHKEKLVNSISRKCNTYFFAGGRTKGFIHQHKAEVGAAVWEYGGNIAEIARAITAKGASVTCAIIRCDTYATVASVLASATDAAAMTVTLGALDTSALPAGVPCAVRITDAHANLTYLDTQPFGIYELLFANVLGFNALDRTDATGGNNAKLQSQALAANAAGNHNRVALNETCFDPILAEIEDRIEGSMPDCVLMHHRQRQRYAAIHQKIMAATLGNGQKITSVNIGTAGAKFGWGDIECIFGSSVPKGVMHFLKWKTFELLELMPLKFQDRDGQTIRHKAGTDNWLAYMAGYHELCCTNPMENGVVVGITP